VFVFSTLQEGLPVAVSEAMLAGVPMVLSDIEPLLEVSQDGEYAEIFPVKDHETLAAKMSELLNDESRRVQLAAKAKKFAAENFSIDSHMRNLTRLYDRLLKKNGEPH